MVLIGDYHCPARRAALRGIADRTARAGGRPPGGVGVETIFARDQHILDEMVRREIDENELRQRIRYDWTGAYDWVSVLRIAGGQRATMGGCSTGSIACRGRICERSERAIVMRLRKIAEIASAIPERKSLCCSASRTLRRDTCRALLREQMLPPKF